MDVQLLTFIIVGASFALYIAIAIWARAGSTNDFYVAGGGVPPVMNGMATAADWMSAASFISKPCAVAAARIPVRTSPLPAVAKADVPCAIKRILPSEVTIMLLDPFNISTLPFS